MMICALLRKTPRNLSQSRINLGSSWLRRFSWSVSMKYIASSAFILLVWYFSCMINILFILWLDLSLFPSFSLRIEACLFNTTLQLQANIFLPEVVYADSFLFEFVTYKNWDQRVKCVFAKLTNSKDLKIFPFF